MYTYKFIQWILFFYIYCFLGWCFESTYVSVRKRQLVNRGFLKGPFLPIYGSGAIVVLFAALPFKSMPVAVYFVGLLAATLLELVTGIVMEALFKVRYWDYSNQKFNYKGHICLSSSIAWGFFSVAMIYGFHRPIEKFVFWLPDSVVTYGTYLLTIIIAADFATSFKTAMELRDLLVAVEKVKNEIHLMQKRVEVIEAVLADEALQRKEWIEEKKDHIIEKKEQIIAEGKERISEKKERIIGESKEQLMAELQELRNKQLVSKTKLHQKLSVGRDKIDMLRRNPTAHSVKEYSPSFETVKSGLSDMRKGWKLREEEVREKMIDNIVEHILELGKKYRGEDDDK